MAEEQSNSKEQPSTVVNHTVSDTIDAALEKLNINITDSRHTDGNIPQVFFPQDPTPSGPSAVPASQVFPHQPPVMGMGFLPYMPHQLGLYPPQDITGNLPPMNDGAHPVFISNAGSAVPPPNFGMVAQTTPTGQQPPNLGLQQLPTDKSLYDIIPSSGTGMLWGAPRDVILSGTGSNGNGNNNSSKDLITGQWSSKGTRDNKQRDNSISQSDDNNIVDVPPAAQNKNNSRRQTFPGISPNDFPVTDSIQNEDDVTGEQNVGSSGRHISMAEHSNGTLKHTNPRESNIRVRSQSMSSQKPESGSLFGKEATSREGTPERKETEEEQADGEIENFKATFTPQTYAAAYPYGGPPLQHKPVGPESHVLGPNFNYRMSSPLPPVFEFPSPLPSFTPVLGGTPPSLPIRSMIPPMPPSPLPIGPGMPERFSPGVINGQLTKGIPNDMGKDDIPPKGPIPMLQSFPILQHPQGSSPPPWIYGSPQYNGMVPPLVHPSMNVPRTPTSGSKGRRHSSSHNSIKNERLHGRGKHGRLQGSNNRQMRFGSGNTSHNNGNSCCNGHGNNGGQVKRSPASAELREMQRRAETNSQYADATLEQFIGSVYLLCRDQHGCRFLQKQLDLLGSEAADIIFKEVKAYTVELMTDCFGNYLIQKLIEKANPEQRLELAKITAPKVVLIASNPHGTRALQKLIACATTDEIRQVIIDSLSGSVVEMSKDLNGNHVIQKCLQEFEPEYCQFIIDPICKNCFAIATHRHGCCVLQRCLDHSNKEQLEKLCDELMKDTEGLTLDPFGNYVIQYIINKEIQGGQFKYVQRIAKVLKPKIIELSVHKFGSNVIEKLLRTPVVSETMIDGLISGGNTSDIQLLLNDSFGNYVLQTALDVSHKQDIEKYERLSSMVSPYLIGNIRNTPHGKRIASMLDSET